MHHDWSARILTLESILIYNTMNRMHMLQSYNGLFVTNPTNIRYLTGFVGVDERDAYVLLTPDILYFFTNSLYIEEAKNAKCPMLNVQLKTIQISRENPISKEVARLCSEQKIKKLGFEDDNLTVSEYTKLQSVISAELVPSGGKIEALRMIKRKDEIENIRLAANVTDQCFSYITKRIRPGVTEARLAWEIESFLKMKAGDIAFSPIVAFNEHSSEPHYNKRGNNPLRKNSLVLLDFGARVNGYCADMTRVVFLGTPKSEWIRAYTTVSEAQHQALEAMSKYFNNIYYHSERTNKPLSGAELDRIARKIIEKAGLPVYPHSLGHAVGLDIHEAPRLTVKKDEQLKPGMVVTVEPGVYVEGSYGVRLEDLVLLKENSIDILSKSPKEIMIL